MNYIFLALTVAFLISITDLCNKSLIEKGVSNFKYTFWTRGVIYGLCILVLVLFVLYNPSTGMTNNEGNFTDMIKLPTDKKIIILILVAGIASFTAILLTYFSFKYSRNVGYTVAIISSTCVFTLLLSKYFFKTEINKMGLFGIGFVILGVYLISLTDNDNYEI